MSRSPRDWRLYADDILEACAKIRLYVDGMNDEAFAADGRTFDAVVRNVEIIGEAAKHLPDDVLVRAPEVAWRGIRGMRDVVAHGDFGVDARVVWSIATTKIDELERAVRRLMV